MSGCGFDGVWKYARVLSVLSPDSSECRDFKGFLEYMNPDGVVQYNRTKSGKVSAVKIRLLSEPKEDFFGCRATIVICEGERFEILSIKEIYIGEGVSHRECVLRFTERV